MPRLWGWTSTGFGSWLLPDSGGSTPTGLRDEVLADHVALVTGIGFPTYLAEAVTSPLGLQATELRGSAGSGLWTSVEDLLVFSDELVACRVWCTAPAVTESLRPQFPDLTGVVPGWGSFDPCPWGLGPELRGNEVTALDRLHRSADDVRALRG